MGDNHAMTAPARQFKQPGAGWLNGGEYNELARRPGVFCSDGSIDVEPTGGGVDLRARGSAVTVQITAWVAYNRYTVDVYANGVFDSSLNPITTPTATGKTLMIEQIAVGSNLPVGTRLTAKKRGAHYEAELGARWL